MNLMLKVDDTEIEENPEFADAQQVGQVNNKTASLEFQHYE